MSALRQPAGGRGSLAAAQPVPQPVSTAPVTVVGGGARRLVCGGWSASSSSPGGGRSSGQPQAVHVRRYPDVHLLACPCRGRRRPGGRARRRPRASPARSRRAPSASPPAADGGAVDLLERFWPLARLGPVLLLMTTTIGPTLTVVGAVGRRRSAGRRRACRPASDWLVIVAVLATPFVLIGYLADALGWDGMGRDDAQRLPRRRVDHPLLPARGADGARRRSRLPLIRWLCTVLIELVRGSRCSCCC